jgi:hypothetical protein
MPSFTGRLALIGWALCLPCCVDGSTADAVAPLSAGASAGGSAGAGGGLAQAGSGGVAGAGDPSAGQATGGSAASVDCSTFTESALSWSLLVQITKEMSQTIYLGQDSMSCDVRPLFQVLDGSNTELRSLDNCHTSCQAMMETGPVACPAVCAMPATVTLEPGQTIQIPWDGRFGLEHLLPQQCLQGTAQAPASCMQAQRIEAALFTFLATAGTRRECLAPGGTCTCTPNPNGGCTSPASLIGGTIYTSEYLVKLEPGEPSPSGEPPYIGILFRDEL